MTPAELRYKLFEDLSFGENFAEEIEVSAEHLLEHVFTDVSIRAWCRALGIQYRVNKNPLEEFRSKTTVIFTKNKPPTSSINDDHL